MNKNRLRELLRTMLPYIKGSADAGIGSYMREQHFLGDNSWVRVQWADGETVEMRPDPGQPIGPSFCLVNEGCDAFEDFVDELATDPVIGNQVGRKAVENAIGALLREFKTKPEAADEELNAAIRQHLQSLRSLVKEWTSVIPVDNFVLQGVPELRMGRVTFRPITNQFIQNTLNRLNAITDTAPVPEHEIQQHRQTNRELVQSNFNAPTYGEVNISAEQGKLPQLVDTEVDKSLNLLRCFTHLLFPRDFRALIGLRGDVIRVMRPCVSFAGELAMSINFQSIGGLQPYVLTNEKVEVLRRRYAFDLLSQVLSKDEASRNSLEKVLVTSVRWLGRSIAATALPEKVLNLAAATERLMLSDNDDKTETGDKQARRMAFLIESDPSARISTYKRAKRYYGLRSEVIHAGRIDVSEEDVAEMEIFMLRSLIAIANRMSEWQSHDDFVRWDQERTFSQTA